MAVLRIRTYGDPVLRRKAEPVTEFNAELKALVADMFETMYDAPGVGLAAPQVGVSKRLLVMDCAEKGQPKQPYVLINPVVIPESEPIQMEEGCLSVPGLYAQLQRPEVITVQGFDADGNPVEIKNATGLLGRCIQHEIDHLDGILFVDKLSASDRILFESKLKKLSRNQKRG